MKNKILKAGVLSFLVLAVLATGFFFVNKYFLSKDAQVTREKAALPTALSINQSQDASTVEDSATPIPEKINWDVPFTSQAPNANWDKTHEEACEEAAVLMAERFFNNQKINGPDDAESGLQEIIAWEMKNLGFFESTTAVETARILSDEFSLKTQIITNPNIDQIKSALADKKLVMVPSAGREIGNPYYTAPGPLYHMLLLKGYTATQFITNDAGTRRGENYPYDFKAILNANHDWNGGDVSDGARVAIFIWR